MGIETAVAGGAEKVGGTDATLPQYQFQVGLGTLRTGFADAAAGSQVDGRTVVVEMIDDGMGVEFGKDEAIFIVRVAAAVNRGRFAGVAGRSFKGEKAHSIDSLYFRMLIDKPVGGTS
jgi:hypothetical protein